MKPLLRLPPTPVRGLGDLVRWFRPGLLWAALLLVLGTVAAAASPYLLAQTVDAATQDPERLWFFGPALFAAMAASTLLYAWGGARASVVGDSAVAAVRDSVVRRLGDADRGEHTRLVSAVSGDAAGLSVFFRHVLPEVLPAVGALVAVTVGMLLVSPLLFALTMCGFVPLVLLGFRLVVANRRQYAAEREASGLTEGALNDLCADRTRAGELTPLLDREYTVAVRAAAVRSVRKGYLVLVEFTVLAVCLLTGLWLVGQGLTTVGAVAAVAVFTFRMAGYVDTLLEHVDEYQLVRVSFTRIEGALAGLSPRGPGGR